MAISTCWRCHGNAFLEQLSQTETAWVCLQCGSHRYVPGGTPSIDRLIVWEGGLS